MEEVALLGRDVGDVARPHGNREQHDVHGREGRDPEAAQERRRRRRLLRLRARRLERIGLEPEFGEAVDDERRVGRPARPLDGNPLVGEVDAGSRDGGNRRKAALDLRHAAGAADAVDRQLEARRAAVPAHEMSEIAHVVHVARPI
jgi:hypothetical protein